MAASDIALEKGLPSNIDAEKFVLGAILLDDSNFVQVAGLLEVDDFSLEKHRRIFLRMRDLADRGERIDRVTVANELMKQNQLESVDGLSYLVSLDDGLPQIFALDSYVKIVKDKSTLRRIVFASQKLIDRCIIGQEEPEEILAGAEETLLKLGESRAKRHARQHRADSRNFEGGINVFLDPSKRIKGISTGFNKFDEMTAGMHEGELIILAARPSMGKTALALNIAHHVATNMQRPEDGRGVLARNVDGFAADAYDLRGSADRPAEVPRRLSESGRAPQASDGTRPAGPGSAVYRRHVRHEPDGRARQAAAAQRPSRASAWSSSTTSS